MPLRKLPHKSRDRTRALLAANRRNARLSTRPRTREGRRRSALNCRKMRFSPRLTSEERNDADLLRLWRDLLAQFWFIKQLRQRWPREFERPRQLQVCLERLAWVWRRKLTWVRIGASEKALANENQWIEGELWSFLFEFPVLNRKADYWLRKAFGSDGWLRWRLCARPSSSPHSFSGAPARQHQGTQVGKRNAGVQARRFVRRSRRSR